jgi:hypothetical protein
VPSEWFINSLVISAAQDFVQINCSLTSPSTEEFYNSICPTLNNARDTIDGVGYAYHCGASPAATDPKSYDAYNPQDCARICSKSTTCTGCVWTRDRALCWLIVQDSRKLSYDGYLLMIPTGTTAQRQGDQKLVVDPTPKLPRRRRRGPRVKQRTEQLVNSRQGTFLRQECISVRSSTERKIETINLDGTVNKWRIYCDHTVLEIDRRTQG